MNKLTKLSTVIAITAALAACGTTPETPDELNANIPDWVLSPSVEDGIAAAACVSASGSMTTDKAQATALSRVDLAQQIGTRVQSLDKTYQERIDVDGQAQVGSTFTSVSKQLTEQSLTGSRVIKTSYANFDGKNQLCVLTALGSSSTKELFASILKDSQRPVTPDQERVLYQEFKAYKAQDELDAELMKNK
ncbi:hypothetical protein GCM10008107_30830 [Psychrosphaera saromensis]|jgi:hypothetical protein|uniref:LPP20 lipoprotein n=1 Tax=Psychrosphaera saromensis TaxID=716813 RepID=A0A2S7UQJ2_9GAMM|nr:LPP20 family lipoprotein [Psychrosphaera saromensis]PQJ52207.1 hypothetical protein BTO11_00080 [Psychrosphaera saromensis]GHB79159.1 hypothetical protein GCM10008107_30830 [Psychrosphaera saromensis]GLQ13713.1 hypothetical protein GCM10007917_11680 [Psychrosphaera saromensis]